MLFSVVGGWLGLNVVHNFESCHGWENLPHLWCNFEALTNLNLDVKYLWQTHGSARPRDVEGQPPWVKKVKIYLRCPWWGKKRMLKQASVILEKWNCLRLNVKLKVKIGFIHLDTKEGGRFPKSCCSDCKNKKSIEGCIHILPTCLAVLHIYQILKVRMKQYMPIWLIFCRSVLLSHIGLVSQRISPVDPFQSLRTRIRIKAWQNIAQ